MRTRQMSRQEWPLAETHELVFSLKLLEAPVEISLNYIHITPSVLKVLLLDFD